MLPSAMKVLIIGDYFSKIKNAINFKNATFYHKHTSLEAQKTIRLKNPDVVVLNFKSALKRGIYQVETLLKLFPELIIIGISEVTSNLPRLDFIKAGGEDCLKIKNLEFLTDTIASAIARRKNITHNTCREKIDKYKLITEYSKDVIWLMDINLKFLYVNPSIKNLRGFTVEEVMQQSFKELFAPESLKIVSGIIKEFISCLKRNEIVKEPYRVEVMQPHKNGNYIPIEVIVNPIFDEQDNFKYFLGISRDISKRKQKEKELLESHELYKFLIENQNDLILKLDPEFNIIFASPQYCKAFNKTEEELIGKSFMPLIHPDDQDSVLNATSQILKKPYKVQHTERILTNDGWTWFEWYDKAVLDKKGIIKEIISVGRNIHAQKVADDAIAESERKFLTLLENLPGMVYSCHNFREWTMEFVSKGCYELTGYAPEELQRDKVVSYNDLIHPEDRNYVWNSIQKAIKNQEHFELKYRIRTKEGNEKWAWERGSYILRKDNQEEMLEGFIFDITEKVHAEQSMLESEEKYQGLFNSIRDAIVISNRDRKIINCNPAFKNMFGYSLDDIKGKPTHVFYNSYQQFEDFGKIIYEYLETETPFIKVNDYKKNDGTVFKGETSVFYLKDSSGEVVGYIGLIRDITQQLAIEDTVFEQQEKLNNIINHSNELFYYHDTEHNFLYLSPQSERIFGYTPKEMMVKWTSLTTDNPINQAGYDRTVKAMETGERQESYLLELKKKDNSKIIAEIDESPVKDDAGNVIGIAGALRDVTEKYFREKELKNLASFVELNPYPTISFNSQGIVTYANPAARYIFGVSIAKNILLSDIFPEQNIEDITKTIRREETFSFYVKSETRTYLFIVKGIPDTNTGHIYGADISSLSKIQEDLDKSKSQLQAYAGYLQSIREEERLSIAREIHDDFSQILSALKMFTTSILKSVEDNTNINTEDIKKEVINMNIMLDKAITAVRVVLKKLRPEVLEDFGLLEAIKFLLEEFTVSSGISSKFICDLNEFKLEHSEQLSVYRICQETLSNITRHSGAANSTFEIREEGGKYFFTISDDGNGFNQDVLFKKESFGIIGMRERASASGGELIINSKPGKGTTIKLEVPIAE